MYNGEEHEEINPNWVGIKCAITNADKDYIREEHYWSDRRKMKT